MNTMPPRICSASKAEDSSISEELANKLGHPGDAGEVVGEISIAAAMEPIEITTVANGVAQSSILPPRARSGRRVIRKVQCRVPISSWEIYLQWNSSAPVAARLAWEWERHPATTETLKWIGFELPNTDHCVIPQNLYRMSGGPNNNERFEQIGQSWMKHAFFALQDNACGFGLHPSRDRRAPWGGLFRSLRRQSKCRSG